jgi:thymidine phosphorylase
MKDVEQARALAKSMVAIGTHAGVRTEAFITDMEAPLGRAIGNALEIIECLDTLKGSGPADLTGVVTRLATRMVLLGGVETDAPAAAARVREALASGRALHTFARMIEWQRGNPRVVDDYSLLPSAPGRDTFRAASAGFVTMVRAESLGRASNLLGAGRATVEEAIDHGVGIVVRAKPGDRVNRGDILLELHHRDGRGLEAALAMCREAVTIGDTAPPRREKVLGEVR